MAWRGPINQQIVPEAQATTGRGNAFMPTDPLIPAKPFDRTPPPQSIGRPWPQSIPVHEPFGYQEFTGHIPPLAPDIAHSRAAMYYPVREGTFLQLFQMIEHPVQAEQDPGFLADLMFYQHPSGLNAQFPSANLPTHLPLEGINYRNTQISEEDYLAQAKARVQAALGRRG